MVNKNINHDAGFGMQEDAKVSKARCLRAIQRGRLALPRERFEFRAAKAALEQLPLANEMRADEDAREEARILAIKKAIFGDEMLKE